MEMDLAGQIRTCAFNEVRRNSAEYRLRNVYRWYSAKFATPLHLVPTLPFSDILTAYFESQFEEMDAEEFEAERKLLIETESQQAERLAAAKSEETSEVDFAKFAETEAKRLEGMQMPAQEPVRPIQHPHRAAPEAEMEAPKEIPPDVTIKFVDQGFFDDLMDKLDGNQ